MRTNQHLCSDGGVRWIYKAAEVVDQLTPQSHRTTRYLCFPRREDETVTSFITVSTKNSFVAAQNKPKHLIRRPEFADVGSFVLMARVEKLSPDISGWFRVWHVCLGWGGCCTGLPWWPPRSWRMLLLFFTLQQIARRQSVSALFTSSVSTTIRTKTVITLRL